MISLPLVRYVLTAARRDRLMLTLVVMILTGGALSVFLGSTANVEKGAFALVFGAGALRVVGVLGLTLFCCYYVRRSFENKEVEFLLSRPISRTAYLLSHAAAFIVLALVVAAAVSAAVYILRPGDIGGWMVWSASLCAEYAIMTSAALFFSMVLTSAAGSALATLGFYVLTRLIGLLLGIAAYPVDFKMMKAMARVLEAISVIVPRLDLMGQSSWMVYGMEGSDAAVEFITGAGDYSRGLIEALGIPGFLAAQGVIFTGLLMSAAAFDFARRRF